MKRPVAVLVALFGVALLTGSACSSGNDSGPNYSSASTTTTASPTPSLSESPSMNSTANIPSGAVSPSRPVVASQHTSDGAFAFVTYYWNMVDWAYATNDGDVLDGLYQPTCASCASFQSSINQSAALGYTLVGGHISISKLSLSETDDVSAAEYGLDVALKVDKLDSRSSSGAIATSYPPSTPTYRIYVAWLSDGWQVVESATVTTK